MTLSIVAQTNRFKTISRTHKMLRMQSCTHIGTEECTCALALQERFGKWHTSKMAKRLRIVCSFAHSTNSYAILFCRLGIEFSLWPNTNQIDSNALRFVLKKVNEIDSVRMKSCMKALHTCASTWDESSVCVCCYTNQLLMDAIALIWSITSLCIRIEFCART